MMPSSEVEEFKKEVVKGADGYSITVSLKQAYKNNKWYCDNISVSGDDETKVFDTLKFKVRDLIIFMEELNE